MTPQKVLPRSGFSSRSPSADSCPSSRCVEANPVIPHASRPVLAIAACLALAASLASTVHAQVTLNALNRGAYDSTGIFGTGGSGTPSGNYLAGLYTGLEYRDFFNFDLTSVSGTILSAQLVINNNNTIQSSPDASETLGIFDYSGSIASLVGGTGGVTAFNDLGTGTSFGSLSLPTTSFSGTGNATINFNAAGIAALNAALGGQFAVGGALTTISSTANQYVFGGTIDFPATQLVLTTVPEPSGVSLLALAALTAQGIRWQSRRKAA